MKCLICNSRKCQCGFEELEVMTIVESLQRDIDNNTIKGLIPKRNLPWSAKTGGELMYKINSQSLKPGYTIKDFQEAISRSPLGKQHIIDYPIAEFEFK